MSDWEDDCLRWRGKVLTGTYAHYCYDWDFLPVDETTPEFSCCCCFSRDAEEVKRSNAWRYDDEA
jgi:hypothetical protein